MRLKMMHGRFLFSKSPFFSIVLFLYVASSSLVILCQGLAAAAEGGGGGAAAVVLRRGVGDDEGGSGFGEIGDSEDLEEEGEEEQEDGSNSQLVMPTRVVPSLRTPLIGEVEEGSSKGKNTAADMAVVYPTAAAAPPADDSDLIFLEEGSGGGVGLEKAPSTPSVVHNLHPTKHHTVHSTHHQQQHQYPHQSPYVPGGGGGGGGSGKDNFIVTDRISNSPPILQRKLKKIPVTAGKSIRWKIPEDTFYDPEDGNTRKLKLSVRHNNGSLLHGIDWLQFNEQTQVLYLLPIDENDIGRWKFMVFAQDRQGQSASDNLEIVVRQYSGSRLVNHQFEIEFSFAQWNPNLLRNWKIQFLDKIRNFFGDPTTENVIVRKSHENPFLFGWTNSSLVQHACRKDSIKELYHLMSSSSSAQDSSGSSSSGSRASVRLSKALGEAVIVREVRLKYYGSCLEEQQYYPTKGSENSHHSSNSNNNNNNNNNMPVIRNPIDVINITAGEFLQFKVPGDTCFDEEDGETTRLSLQLLTTNRKEVSTESWLHFDSKNQEFIGVPLAEEVGREEYQLVCSDQSGLSVIDGIEVVVLNRPFSERYGVEFLLQFQSDVVRQRRVLLVQLISSLFGDATPGNVVLKSIERNHVTWYNKTLSYANCQDSRVQWIIERLSMSDEASAKELREHFSPLAAVLTSSNIAVKGVCVHTTPFPTDDDDHISSGGEDEDRHNNNSKNKNYIFHGIIPSVDYLMTFLIPAMAITLMLLLAIVLACVLHKKRRAGKLNLFYSEALPPRVPVILQDELVEDLNLDQSLYRPAAKDAVKMMMMSSDVGGGGGGGGTHPPPPPSHPTEYDSFLRGGDSSSNSFSRPTPTYHR